MPILRVRLNKLSSDWQVARALLENEYTSLDKALNKFRTRHEFAAHLLDVHRMWCVRRALARPGCCLPVRSDGDAAHAARSKIYVSASTQTDIQSYLERTNPISDLGLLIKQERASQEHRDLDMESSKNESSSQQRNEEGIPTPHIRSDVQSHLERTNPVSALLIKQERASQEHRDLHMESARSESSSQKRNEKETPTQNIVSDVQSNCESTNQVSDLLIKVERASQEHCDVGMNSSRSGSTSQQKHEGIPTHHIESDIKSSLERTNPVSDLLIKQEEVSHDNCDVDMDSSRNESTSHQRHEEVIPTQNIGSDVQSNFESTNPVSDLLIKQEVVSKENHDLDIESSKNESTSHQRHEEVIPKQNIGSDVQPNFENTNPVSDLIKQEVASQEHCDLDMESSRSESASHQRNDEGIPTQNIGFSGMKETRQRRKRKLIVDEQKELAGDVLKSQLKDTSDIVCALDLAPPTKKLMLGKETGGAEKLFCLPARQHTSIFILSIYRRNLTADIPKDFKIMRDEDFELEEPEVHRRVEHHDYEKTILENVSRPSRKTHHRNTRSPEGLAPDLCDEDVKMIVHSNNGPSSSNLHNDERSPEGSSQDLCDADGKTLLENVSRPSRTTHHRNKRSPKGLAPDLCDEGISSNKNVQNPSRSERRKSFHCKSCSKTYLSLSVFHLHLKTHAEPKLQSQRTHTREKPSNQCSVCEKDFITKDRLAVHMRTHSGRKLYQCSVCDKAFTRNDHLKFHMRTHSGEKPFECNSCSYRCSKKSHLTLHMRTHTGEKPFECNCCSYRCSQKSNLTLHMRTHSGQKPYQCSVCIKAFTTSGNLSGHMRTHTGEKPFECNCCSYRCSHKSSLIFHMRTHSGEKPFECSSCSYRCSKKSNLTLHMRTHTGEKPFECNCCSYRCSQKCHLTLHMRTHTGDEPF